MDWSVMLFAAGFGTRMKHLTRDRPKPMVEVAGLPLIDHTLMLTDALPAKNTVVNLHYKPKVLEAHLVDRDVQTIVEAPDILDTGGGLRNALPLLGQGPVMTLNTDAIWGGTNPLKVLQDNWDPAEMDGLLLCIPPERTVGYDGTGNFLVANDGRVSRGNGLIYGGAQIVKTEKLHKISEKCFSLNLLWDMMIDENSLYAIEYEGRWCDVGHPDGVPLAEKMLEDGDV